MSRIYALFGGFFAGLKYGGVPKMTNIRCAHHAVTLLSHLHINDVTSLSSGGDFEPELGSRDEAVPILVEDTERLPDLLLTAILFLIFLIFF